MYGQFFIILSRTLGFWTAYLAACLLIQNEHCYFLAPQTLYKRGRVLGRERGGEGIL